MSILNRMFFKNKINSIGGCPAGATQFSDIIVGSSQYMSDTTTMVGNVCFPNCTSINDYWTGYVGAFMSCTKLQQITMPNCTYLGSVAFKNCTTLSTVSFPNCTYIGNSAFQNCTLLSTASFSNCTYIGYSAFFECTSLKSVYFPNIIQPSIISMPIFMNCSLLSDANIIANKMFPAINTFINPETATSINHCIFTGTGISSASFPNCTYIGKSAFYSCTLLSLASFPQCTYISRDAFSFCTTLKTVYFPKCSYVGNYAFYKCSSLTTVEFPQCDYIEGCAFALCTSLTTISFPQCTYIKDCAFSDCTSLTSIEFPVCSYIDDGCFEDCTALKTAIFPQCKYIGTYGFIRCALTSISFPELLGCDRTAFNDTTSYSWVSSTIASMKEYSSNDITTYYTYYMNNFSSILSTFPKFLLGTSTNASAIYHSFFMYGSFPSASFPLCTYIGEYAFDYCKSLTTIFFPLCSYIGNDAFGNCKLLPTAEFPQCSYIGIRTFCSCSALTTVSFPKCSYVGNYAFTNCYLLSTISLPYCSYIGVDAFRCCSNLSTIYIGTSISSVCVLSGGSTVFQSTALTTGSIYVPASLLTTYQSATGWSYFSTQLIGI